MNNGLIIFAILEIIGGILLILGYLIKFKGMIQLVAGVSKNDDKILDKKGFGSFVGGNIIILGIVFCVGALAIYIYPDYKVVIEPILLLSLLIIGILLFIGTKKYIAS